MSFNTVFDAYTVRLTYMDDTTEDIKYTSPIHLVESIPYGIVNRIQVGDNLRVYGMMSQKVNGVTETKYLHLDAGDYPLKNPILFQSFHVNKIL